MTGRRAFVRSLAPGTSPVAGSGRSTASFHWLPRLQETGTPSTEHMHADSRASSAVGKQPCSGNHRDAMLRRISGGRTMVTAFAAGHGSQAAMSPWLGTSLPAIPVLQQCPRTRVNAMRAHLPCTAATTLPPLSAEGTDRRCRQRQHGSEHVQKMLIVAHRYSPATTPAMHCRDQAAVAVCRGVCRQRRQRQRCTPSHAERQQVPGDQPRSAAAFWNRSHLHRERRVASEHHFTAIALRVTPSNNRIQATSRAVPLPSGTAATCKQMPNIPEIQ